jgi:hypothetical protein
VSPNLGETAFFRPVYFDTSSWNEIAKHRERDGVIEKIQQAKRIVLVSVRQRLPPSGGQAAMHGVQHAVEELHRVFA